MPGQQTLRVRRNLPVPNRRCCPPQIKASFKLGEALKKPAPKPKAVKPKKEKGEKAPT